MYFDDPYDPNLENDYDDEAEPAKYYDDDMSSDISHHNRQHRERNDGPDYEDESSIASSTRLAQRRLIEKAKQSDPGYFTVKRSIQAKSKNSGGKSKPKTIGYYHTPSSPGMTIRNAVSGLYETGRRTGSKEQDLFFKVAMCTGENGPDTHFLFYDSPAQFERHFFCQVADDVMEKWNLTSNVMRLACAKAEEAANDGKYKRISRMGDNVIEVK